MWIKYSKCLFLVEVFYLLPHKYTCNSHIYQNKLTKKKNKLNQYNFQMLVCLLNVCAVFSVCIAVVILFLVHEWRGWLYFQLHIHIDIKFLVAFIRIFLQDLLPLFIYLFIMVLLFWLVVMRIIWTFIEFLLFFELKRRSEINKELKTRV